MLESFVAWVLNNYVGEYFRLNTDQLSIALLQGQVDLENVPLRATALSKFDIPVQVKCGVIGSLQLRIPLAHIRSQPWTLRLRDCLALLGPSSTAFHCHDVQTVDKWQQQKRERWLDEVETMHKRKLLEQLGIESTDETAEQDSWWGASLLSSISNNIQVILENAHIRYECPSFNFGVKIQSVTIQTTNANWRPGFVQNAEGVNIFKKIDISGFSIYWNPMGDSRQQGERVRLVPSYEMLKEELGSSSANCAVFDQFVLLPFSLEVRIERNSSRFPLLRTVPNTPRFKLDIRSQRIELELNKRQIAQIQSLANDWAQFDRARPHRKWRPLVSVCESPKQWWRFAIGRTLDEVRARRPFFPRATVLTRVRLVNRYARAYRRRLKKCVELHSENDDGKNDHLSCSTPPISSEDIALIKQIEHGSEFTYNVLHSLREAVFQKMMLKPNIGKQHSRSHNESPFEIIKSESRPINRQMSEKIASPTTTKTTATGWYGWITNWFTEEADGNDAQDELKNNDKDANEALYLSMKPPKLTRHKLDPELKAVESRMEAEILQMLNESWDESNILRRDNLLAEIMLNVSKVFFRFSEEEDDESKNEEEKPSSSSSLSNSTTAAFEAPLSAIDVQLLTFDLSRLCSRIHLSPKEHRTEVSLSVADLTVQRVQHHRHQQQRKTETLAESSGAATSVYEKKKANGNVSAGTAELNSFGSDEFDESLIYGFQQKNAQNMRLLLAIGRTYDENCTKEANGSKKRNERLNFHQKSKRKIGAVSAHCSSSSAAPLSEQTPTDENGHRAGDNNAILRLFYKRLAPKLEVYHELNVSCAPLSIICDECAFNGILEPFTQKTEQSIGQTQQANTKEHLEFASSSTETVTHQLFASVTIPELAIELRSEKAAQGYLLKNNGQIMASTSSNLSESDANFQPFTPSFARSNFYSLHVTFSRRNSHRLKPTATTRLLVKSDNLCVRILEEGNKINMPFLRFNIRDLRVKSTLSRVRADFNLSIDYYRLRTLPGWEPLLEHYNKFCIDADFANPNQWNVLLKHVTDRPIELTFTQMFIERVLDFVSHWNSIRQLVHHQSQALEQLMPATLMNAGSASTFNVLLEFDDGFGISLVGIVDKEKGFNGQKQEELCYGRFRGVKLNIAKSKATYRINCQISSIQIDNQIIGADRWQFLFCDPNALKDEPMVGLPALAFEMSYTPTEFFDIYECFRLKLSNTCILLDEQLLWRLVHLVRSVLRRSQSRNDKHRQQEKTGKSSISTERGGEHLTDSSASFLDNKCYFGTLQLEFGNISLSVLTVDKNTLSPSIRQLKDFYSDQIILYSFENALVTLAPFCWLRCFCSVGRLFDTLINFYFEELKRQKLNIIFAMDAFGNPMAFGNDLKECFQGLIFEGDLAGFAFGLGYGAANSISKVTSSMAQGVGSLTFDEKHEELRRRMRRAKPEQSGPLTHLYDGIKGLGVGVFGGLTAILKNTVTATQEEGFISGIARGVTTGAIDTVTKPLQGTLDLLEGTASAVKEIVGAPLVRRAHFPDHRLRPSRVCSSLSGLLPVFNAETAEAQIELIRITGTYTLNDENRLLAVVPFLVRTNLCGARVVQRALINIVQCCIVRQVDNQPSMVTYRILFQHLNTVQLLSNNDTQQQYTNSNNNSASGTLATQQRLTLIEFVCNSEDHPHRHSSEQHQQRHQALTLWCSDRETAKQLCKQIMRAKALFDRRRATGDKMVQRNAKKLKPIFTV